MIRKTFLLLVSTLIFVATTQAQNQGVYFTFAGGPSFPTGAYSDMEGDGSGYAELGINGTAGVGFRLNEMLSLGGRFAFTQNPVDPSATFLEETPWKSNFFLADITAGIPVGSSLSVEASLLGGFAQTLFPDGSFNIGDFSFTNEGGKGGGAALGGELGLRYWLDDYISFKLGATYLGSNPTLGDENQIEQKIRMLNTNFGISITMD
jgi:hypothetical protein